MFACCFREHAKDSGVRDRGAWVTFVKARRQLRRKHDESPLTWVAVPGLAALLSRMGQLAGLGSRPAGERGHLPHYTLQQCL